MAEPTRFADAEIQTSQIVIDVGPCIVPFGCNINHGFSYWYLARNGWSRHRCAPVAWPDGFVVHVQWRVRNDIVEKWQVAPVSDTTCQAGILRSATRLGGTFFFYRI